MAWTETARREYARRGRRYSSDLSDHEWAIIAPLLPPARSTGRPRTTDLRAVMDAVLYMASSGCQWCLLPKDFPPPSTVQRYFYDWRDSGLLATINHHLVMAVRELEALTAEPRHQNDSTTSEREPALLQPNRSVGRRKPPGETILTRLRYRRKCRTVAPNRMACWMRNAWPESE